MSTLRAMFLFFTLMVVLGCLIFLLTWDQPPEIKTIERQISIEADS